MTLTIALAVLPQLLSAVASDKSIDFDPKANPSAIRYRVYRAERRQANGSPELRFFVMRDAIDFQKLGLGVPLAHTIVVLASDGSEESARSKSLLPALKCPQESPSFSGFFELKAPSNGKFDDLKINVLAMASRCMNPTIKECAQLKIDSQLAVTGADLRKLPAVTKDEAAGACPAAKK